MKNIIFLFALSVIVLSSCSDSKTPTDPGGDSSSALLPSTVGSYWINSNVETTPPPTVTPVEDTRNTDSVVITGNGMYQGRQATTQMTFVNGVAIDTSYFHQNANELYAYNAAIQTEFFSLPPGWVKLADYNATSWKAFNDTTITNYQMEFDGQPATINGTLKTNTVRGGTSSVQLDGKAYTATTFTTTVNINLVAKPTALPIDIPLNFDVVTTIKHVKGLGVVSSETQGFTFSVPLIGEVPTNGNSSTLLRFKINP